MMMANEISVLSEFIRRDIGYDGALDVAMDLVQAQVLDSFNIVQLAMFVKERFEVELEAEDLVRANLSTLANIAALIKRKQAAVP